MEDKPRSELLFFLADVRAYLTANDKTKDELADELTKNYFEGELPWLASSPKLQRMVDDEKKKHTKLGRESFETAEKVILRFLCDHFTFSTVLQGCITSATYRKRAGGSGDIPDQIFNLLKEQTQSTKWVEKVSNSKVKILIKEADETVSILQKTTTQTPMHIATEFLQARDLFLDISYKSRTIVEEIGPQTNIVHYILRPQQFSVAKPLDLLLFESTKQMPDGSFVVMHCSVDHISLPADSNRLFIESGGFIVNSMGDGTTEISVLATLNSKQNSKWVNAAMSKGKEARNLKKGIEQLGQMYAPFTKSLSEPPTRKGSLKEMPLSRKQTL